MMWYAHMFNQDREEKFDSDLNMTEYLASFINYESVRQTREARENKKVVSDDDFDQLIRDKFGRDLPPEALATATRADVADEPKPVQEVKRKGNISLDDIKKYTGLDLDDIKFIPNKK